MLKTVGRFLADWFGITDLRDHYRAMGNPPLFWTLIVGTIAFIGIFAWLMEAATWPGSCDHEGRRLAGIVKSLGCSADLLSGGPREIGLFVALWTLPAVLMGACFWRLVYEIRRRIK